MDYQDMSLEQLEAANAALMAQRAEIKQEQLLITQLIDQKQAEQDLARDMRKLQEKHGVDLQVKAAD